MPKVSKQSAAQVDDYGPVESRHEEVSDYTIEFVSFRQDIDGTPLLKGLPGDSCSCPHWGYVLKGKLTFRFADHEEAAAVEREVEVGQDPLLQLRAEVHERVARDEQVDA